MTRPGMRAGGLLLLMSIIATIIGVPTPVAAQNSSEVPSDGGLELLEQDISTGPAGTFSLRLQLPGIIADDDELTVAIHEPVESEASFRDSLVHRLGGVLVSRSDPLSELDIDARLGELDIVFDLNDGSLGAVEPGQIRLVRPGIYPLSISLRTADQDQIGSIVTYLIRTPDPPLAGEEPRRLGVVLLLDLVSATGSGSSSTIDSRRLLENAPDLRGTTGTLVMSPSVIDELWGAPTFTSFIDGASQWEFVAQPYLPVDEAALRRAGLDEELLALIQRGADTLRRVREPASPALWFGRTLDADTADALWQRGVRDLIIPRDVLDSNDVIRGPIDLRSEAGTFRALVTNSELLDRQHQRDQVLAAHQTLAHLAVIGLEPDQSTLVLDLGTIEDPRFATTLVAGLERLDLIDVLPATEGLRQPRQRDENGNRMTAELVDTTSSTRLDYSGFRDARDQLASLRSMINDDDSSEVDALTADLHQSLSTTITDAERTTTWNNAIRYVRREINLLDPPPLDSIRLTSRSALVPFSFQNRADHELRVEVRILSDKLRVDDFDDGESTTIVLPPGVTTHEFTLTAQTSGTFPVTIEVYSPDGALQISSTRTSVRATAPTGVGLALTISAAAFLIVWWIVDVMRKRRAGAH